MSDDGDDKFKPKLGRMRNIGNASGKRYLNRVLNSAGKMNPSFAKSRSGKSFTGRNMGRGSRATASTGSQRFRQRRVVIKARFVKLAGAGLKKAAAHLKYVQRDGVSKESEPGQLYNDVSDDVDSEKFLERGEKDRHQFRFIVSPEDAVELTDMIAFTRDLMAQAETDLETKLDWVAVDHFNTDNPHTHIIVRGVDERGADLVIAKDYIARGFRERASDLVTAELGPRQDHEINTAMRKEVSQDRFTSIDHALLRRIKNDGIDMRDDPGSPYGRFKRSLDLARLDKLEKMGLAEQTIVGRWRLSDQMEPTLRALGQRGDIIKLMHAEMTRLGRSSLSADYEIFRPQDQPKKTITGQIVTKGLSDEFSDRYYLVVDGVDGKTHYAEVGQIADIDTLKVGSIVELEARNPGPRSLDQTISTIAKNNNGLYSADLHTVHDRKASKEFVRAHVRRLEALRRENIVRRFLDDSWEVPDSYLDDVTSYENRIASRTPVNVLMRSSFSLDVQSTATGATWLDRTLLDRSSTPIANTGFVAEVEAALKKRQAYLIAQGLAHESANGVTFQRGLLVALERREVEKAAHGIAQETGKTYSAFKKSDRIEGVYSRDVNLVSGKYAMIEQSKEFKLVPWRSVLDRARGRPVSGFVGGNGISWDIGRKRGLGVS